MHFTLNGEPQAQDTAPTVAELVRGLVQSGDTRGCAVAIDGEVVRRATWDERSVSEGDAVEILLAHAGG